MRRLLNEIQEEFQINSKNYLLAPVGPPGPNPSAVGDIFSP